MSLPWPIPYNPALLWGPGSCPCLRPPLSPPTHPPSHSSQLTPCTPQYLSATPAGEPRPDHRSKMAAMRKQDLETFGGMARGRPAGYRPRGRGRGYRVSLARRGAGAAQCKKAQRSGGEGMGGFRQAAQAGKRASSFYGWAVNGERATWEPPPGGLAAQQPGPVQGRATKLQAAAGSACLVLIDQAAAGRRNTAVAAAALTACIPPSLAAAGRPWRRPRRRRRRRAPGPRRACSSELSAQGACGGGGGVWRHDTWGVLLAGWLPVLRKQLRAASSSVQSGRRGGSGGGGRQREVRQPTKGGGGSGRPGRHGRTPSRHSKQPWGHAGGAMRACAAAAFVVLGVRGVARCGVHGGTCAGLGPPPWPVVAGRASPCLRGGAAQPAAAARRIKRGPGLPKQPRGQPRGRSAPCGGRRFRANERIKPCCCKRARLLGKSVACAQQRGRLVRMI